MDTISNNCNNTIERDLALDLIRRRRARSDETQSRVEGFGRFPLDLTSSSPSFLSCLHHTTAAFAEASGKALISPGLYGRDEERSTLICHFKKVLMKPKGSGPQLLLVTGPSGMGKTSLVMSLKGLEKATLAKGKFEVRQASPYAAFSELISGLLLDLTENKEPLWIEREKTRIKEALGEDLDSITVCIPCLGTFLGKPAQCVLQRHKFVGQETLNRFRSTFCKLIACLCSFEKPLVFFLDDLQWAEKEELELLSVILTDTSIEGLIVYGACRDNEVAITDELAVMLRHLEDEESLQIAEVALTGLRKSFILQMTTDLLGVTSDECHAVGSFLFESCKGQPLHTLQLLRTLQVHDAIEICDGSVYFDETLAKKILNEAGGDAVQLVSNLLRSLPSDTRDWLSKAACLGSEFDGELIKLASGKNCKDCASCAIEAGLIRITRGNDGRKHFRFVHDVVQQASYELIDRDKQPEAHFEIGMKLWSSLKRKDLGNQHAIAIAIHVQYGTHFLKEETERVDAAGLFLLAANLLAAKMANLASSFSSALSLLRSAVALLPFRNRWRDYYQLCLDIHACAAETEYLTGNFDESDELCEAIIANAFSEVDKIPAYTSKMFSLGSRSRYQEAIDLGLHVLSKLGESIPRKPGMLQVLLAFRQTEGMLKNLSEGDIIGLPRMTDPTKLAATQILNVLFTYAYTQSSLFRAMVSSKMIQITMHHGLSACSAVGFAFHAVLLITSFERISEGYRYGQISLQLLETFGLAEYVARVYVYIYGCVNSISRPVNECFLPLEHAYQCGMVTGDAEFSLFALHLFNSIKLYQGTPVRLIYDEALRVRHSMLSVRQSPAAMLHEAFLHAVSAIAGVEVPVITIDGVAMTRDAMIDIARKEGIASQLVVIYGNWATEHFWNGEYYDAMTQLRKARQSGLHSVIFHFRCALIFFEGMSNFILVSESSQGVVKKWACMQRGRRSLRFLRKHAMVASENIIHQVHLLEAIYAGIKGDWQLSMSKYNLAKERTQKLGLLAEEALVNELVGRAIMRRNAGERNVEAVSLICKARDLYSKWGALQKVRQMESLVQKTA